jgi:hypothetical protein
MRGSREPPAWWLTALCVGLMVAGALAIVVWVFGE